MNIRDRWTGVKVQFTYQGEKQERNTSIRPDLDSILKIKNNS